MDVHIFREKETHCLPSSPRHLVTVAAHGPTTTATKPPWLKLVAMNVARRRKSRRRRNRRRRRCRRQIVHVAVVGDSGFAKSDAHSAMWSCAAGAQRQLTRRAINATAGTEVG